MILKKKMTKEGWREIVYDAVMSERNRDDPTTLDLLVEVLIEQENAKQLLRDKGYGVTGTGLLETVKEVPNALSYNDEISVIFPPKNRKKIMLRVLSVEEIND